MSFETAAILLAWAAIVILALGFSGVLRQVRVLSRMLDSSRARAGAVLGATGPRIDGWHREPDHVGLILFASSGCSSCREVVPTLGPMLAARNGGDVDAVVVYKDAVPAGAINTPHVAYVVDESAFVDYGVHMVPTAVHLAPDGRVEGIAPVGSVSRLDAFLREVSTKEKRP